MKKILLLSFLFCLTGMLGKLSAQVYLDDFDNDDPAFISGIAAFSFGEMDSELTITGDGATGPWDPVIYQPHDPDAGMAEVVDATSTNKIYVRAKASNVGTQLRLDLQDTDGYATSQAGITKTLTTEFMVLEYDFTGNYIDGGFGGTPCMTGPCPVDGSMVEQLLLFINPGVGGFGGSVVIDYIAFGTEPVPVIMSDIFQDHFEMDSSIGAFNVTPVGYEVQLDTDNSEIRFVGDGTSIQWQPFDYTFRNPVTLDTLDIDMSGNNKLFVKAKANMPSVALRVDVQDIDGFITTEGSITKVLTEEYVVYEYDFTGVYNDLGYGGTPCTDLTAPCPVDPTRIRNITIFIEPGGTEFLGTVSLDFISFGVSLDPPAPPGVLEYGDHCNNNATDNVVDPFGLVSAETDSEWTITGDGSATPYSAVAYNTFDQSTGENIVVNATGNNKLYVRASSTIDAVPLRIDLVDTAGYVTSLASLTRSISTDMQTYEYDYSANYQDGGYGGTACMTGPCPVDGSAISTVLLYPNPVDGMYDGVMTIDYISFGAPMGADVGPIGVANYSDNYNNDDLTPISDMAGLVSSIVDSEWTINGDGTSGAFAPVVYDIHDQTDGSSIIATSVGSNDKLYIRAKSTIDGTQLRIDLQDQEGYVTSSPSVVNDLTTEFTVIEFDYANTYTDGGFGGTPCTAGPCDVDGERVDFLQLFIDPGTGMFNGEITIDWISFGQPFNTAPTGVLNYSDDYVNDDLSFIVDQDGLTSSITDGIWDITGDGTSGAFAPSVYSTHNLTSGDSIAVDAVGSGDKLYIRAKSSNEGTMLRIDLQDAQGYVTSNPAVEQPIGTEYETIEFDYENTYTDGGFGGSPCTAGPCPVDGQRVSNLQFFIDPGTGMYNGVLSIDWISFGAPIDVSVDEIPELDAYKIFPNPTAGKIGVELDLNQQGDLLVNVYDAIGRLVHTENGGLLFAGNQFTKVDISHLNNGLYFVQVIVNNKNTKAIAIIKQ